MEIPNKLTAGASFDQNVSSIKEGKAKERVGLVEGDNRFNIAVETIQKGWLGKLSEGVKLLSGRYVKVLKEDGSPLLLNVNSVASRLHLTKEKVKEIAQEDGGLDKLREQSSRVKTILDEVIGLTEDFSSNEKSKEGIEKIRTIFRVSKEDGSDQIDIGKLQEITKGMKSSQLEGRIIYHGDSKGEGSLLRISKQLGKGGFGVVYSVQDLERKNAPEEALKLATAETIISEAAQRDVQNEYEVLKKLHSHGECLGIMKTPRKMVSLSRGDSIDDQRVGYLGHRYECDYSHHLSGKGRFSTPTSKNEIGDKFFEFYQLLSGLAKLQESGIIHGDLKPENIYFEKQNGESRVYIGDFGSADKEPLDSEKFSYSPSYCSISELDERFKLAKDMKSNAGKLKELDSKRDVFAMGVVLYQSLTGDFPYPVTKVGEYLEAEQGKYREISNESVPLELKNIIRKMLAPAQKERVSAKEAFIELTDALEKFDGGSLKQRVKLLGN